LREIHVRSVTDAVRELCLTANCDLPPDVAAALARAREAEESPLGKQILEELLDNAAIARQERMPMCQDTGVVHVFVELGQDVRLTGGDLKAAIDEGVRQGYEAGYLRKSVVDDPIFRRANTQDNTPAIVYIDLVPGEHLSLAVVPKGTGSENMSGLKMLTPAQGTRGIRDFVVEVVDRAGSNPCPPVIVGVGVGGMMDRAAMLAKKALLREVGTTHPDPSTAALEREILQAVNDLGIGPAGLGGRTTALAVHIETAPTHIGALPVAVNLQCHAARHAERTL
jgi:fumarate hydratase subunit alpha